ncbi:unnamed protein product [Vicia faba]|uniref:Uncharacterized protein n=1 Tax=Vicia faba TaxID=3906 RepID=A0AAV1A304_VICFA|nr:unnamed protein product [Vicia faba]
MHSKWPSLTSDDHIFWNNQWIKHGSCSGWPRVRYINEVLEFYEAYKLLMSAGIISKYEYTFQRALRNIYRPIFEAADWEANGEVVELVIGVDCLNLNQLYQIRVCKTSDSNNFKDCPYQGNCPRVFRYVKYKVNEKPTPQSLIPKNIILIIPTIGKGMNSKVGAKISQVGPKPTGVAGRMGGWRLGTSEPISQKVSPLKVLDNVNLLHKSNKSYLPLCCNKDSELKSSNTSLEDCSRSFSGFSFPDEDSLTHDGPFSTLEVLEVRIPPRIDSFMSSPESNLIEDDLDSPDSTFEDDQHPGYDCSVKGAPELNTKSDDAFFCQFQRRMAAWNE